MFGFSYIWAIAWLSRNLCGARKTKCCAQRQDTGLGHMWVEDDHRRNFALNQRSPQSTEGPAAGWGGSAGPEHKYVKRDPQQPATWTVSIISDPCFRFVAGNNTWTKAMLMCKIHVFTTSYIWNNAEIMYKFALTVVGAATLRQCCFNSGGDWMSVFWVFLWCLWVSQKFTATTLK